MNRILLSVFSVAVAHTALGQTPAPPPTPSANVVTDNSKVARFLAGPSGHPEGFLLRNGTFVILPPGLSQRMPFTIPANASVSVAGDEFTYEGNRTIHARRITVAGVSYQDVAPTIGAPPASAGGPPPPPAAPGGPRPPAAPAPPVPPAPPAPPRGGTPPLPAAPPV